MDVLTPWPEWRVSNRADPAALPLADRHYNRQKIGSPQFVPPGRCFVLLTSDAKALWVTSWPFAQYVKHAWAGAWMNSMFRNESEALSSFLIIEAVKQTYKHWPDIPDLGMVTFIDMDKVKRKRDYGRCYRRAGFRPDLCRQCGGIGCKTCEYDGEARTKGGLLVLRMCPEDIRRL